MTIPVILPCWHVVAMSKVNLGPKVYAYRQESLNGESQRMSRRMPMGLVRHQTHDFVLTPAQISKQVIPYEETQTYLSL